MYFRKSPQDILRDGNSNTYKEFKLQPQNPTPDANRRVAELSVPAAQADWAHLLAEHERWLRTVILARLGDSHGVDETLQEVALAVVRQNTPIDAVKNPAAWLYQIAVRQALLYRRTLGRRRKLIDRFVRRQPSDGFEDHGDPLGWLLAEERHEQVREALKRLSKRDREILLLKYTEDWSYKELAEKLGASQSAIEARLHRARQRLREELTATEAAAQG